jgi:hypothetical protein
VISNLDRYQRIAPFYDLLDLPFERRRYRALRPLLFCGLAGRLLDACRDRSELPVRLGALVRSVS